MKPLPWHQWVGWIAATATAAFTMSAYAFGTFETKVAADGFRGMLISRLDRIEKQLDALLELQQRRSR